MESVYHRLAKHLEDLIMGYPFSDALIDLLKAMFNPEEAEVALAIPNHLAPLEVADVATIVSRTGLSAETVSQTLDALAARSLLFSAPLKNGETGYALYQIGYGVPQAFLWAGKQDETAKRMARLIINYFKVPVTREVYGGQATKCYKYTPGNLTVDIPMQGVMPHEQMAPILKAAEKIAVAHCPCRMSAMVLGRTDCRHSLEVCIKYDALAEFVVRQGLARDISKDEARQILIDCEKEGLVHMVDNAQGRIKHTCNCCGHYCWNVGIIQRRKIPRDALMAVYFLRETDVSECVACGACVEICPVNAVALLDDTAQIDPDWCIGCGVCAVDCPTEAISIVRRPDKGLPPKDFSDLHRQIRTEKNERKV